MKLKTLKVNEIVRINILIFMLNANKKKLPASLIKKLIKRVNSI